MKKVNIHEARAHFSQLLKRVEKGEVIEKERFERKYTIRVGDLCFVVIGQIVKANVSFDPFKSFTPVINVAVAPEMFSVHPSVSTKTGGS